MSAGYGFDVKDEASARAWKEKVQRLNDQTERTVREAAQVLAEFKSTAEGNVFEQVCTYSDNVITGLTEVMRGMNKILSAVDGVINMVKEKGKELVDGVIQAGRNFLGV